jgi:periplasmic copper chaperone A
VSTDRGPHRAAVLAVAVAVALVVAVTACGGGPDGTADIELTDAAVGATTSAIAAMYLTVTNHGDGRDALVGASCSCAAQVTLHLTEHDGGLAKMVDTDRLELEPGASVALDPAGSHLMLEQLDAPLTEGDTVAVVVAFERSPDVTLEVPVVGLASLAERAGA